MKKQYKHQKTINLGEVSIDGSIESAIAELESMKDEFSSKHDGLYLEIETYQLPYDDYYYARVVLYGEREETDSEFEARLLEEKKYKERIEEREKKELERLTKLYGKKEK